VQGTGDDHEREDAEHDGGSAERPSSDVGHLVLATVIERHVRSPSCLVGIFRTDGSRNGCEVRSRRMNACSRRYRERMFMTSGISVHRRPALRHEAIDPVSRSNL
jgi:hypothetical protein